MFGRKEAAAENESRIRELEQEIADFDALPPLADGLDAAAFIAVEPLVFVGMHVLAAARNVALERMQINV